MYIYIWVQGYPGPSISAYLLLQVLTYKQTSTPKTKANTTKSYMRTKEDTTGKS